ncbi:MAG: hypothetical protein IKJ59_10210 [Clostridia bacterium]|nr:hypothetical protein [Clostridia bacterium]
MVYNKLLQDVKTSQINIDVFGGYNHNLSLNSNEFFDMRNLTSDNYPILSPRSKRGDYEFPTKKPLGMIDKDALYYVDEGRLYYNGKEILDFELDAETEKNLVSMGAYLLIFPDKKYINTQKLEDRGNIEETFTSSSTVNFDLCKIDASLYPDNIPAQPSEPSNPNNLDLWIDTSSTPNTLKQFSKTNAAWVAVTTTYIKISSLGIGEKFNKFDGVTISGIAIEDLQDINNTMVVWEKAKDYIVVVGLISIHYEQQEPIKIERLMPQMDFVTESGNRLWGCKYGQANNGQIVNEIYCSKLGDFKNWNCFMGLSTDSYVASVGTDGHFTGAITHMGYPLFFKENSLHKVYGTFPSNFQIQTTACRGVQLGSSKSLVIVNEVLFYLSRSGICAYDGSLPVEMSQKLGNTQYHNAVAGVVNNKYYVSMADNKNLYHLFVFDSAKGLWHKEDDTQVVQFCNCQGELYYIDKETQKIKTVLGKGNLEKKPVSWLAETGVLSTDTPNKKYIYRLNVRMSLDLNTVVRMYIQYDSQGDWEQVVSVKATNLRTFTLPIKPKRCDHLRLRIVGEGEAKIYSITQHIEQGSDV